MLIKAGLAGVLCNVIVGTKLEYEVSTVICGDINNDRYPGPWLVVPDNCSRSKFSFKKISDRETRGVVCSMFYQEVLHVVLESHPKDLHRFHNVRCLHSTERPSLCSYNYGWNQHETLRLGLYWPAICLIIVEIFWRIKAHPPHGSSGWRL